MSLDGGRGSSWRVWVLGIVATLIAGAVVGGVSAVVRGQIGESQISDLKSAFLKLDAEVDGVEIRVNGIAQTCTLSKLTSEGLHRTLEAHLLKFDILQDRVNKLSESQAELRAALIELRSRFAPPGQGN